MKTLVWKCSHCGRDKFSRPFEPHRCNGGFRKRFKVKTTYLLNYRRQGEELWTLEGIVSDRGVAERVFTMCAAEGDPIVLSSVSGEAAEGGFDETLRLCGYPSNSNKIADPPGTILKKANVE